MSTAIADICLDGEVVRNDVPDFNHLAHLYRWMEWLSFGPFLWRCRCWFLSRLRCHQQALVLGDGDGRFAARLLAQNPEIAIDAVDGSAAMLRELMRRAGSDAGRVRAHVADARTFLPARHDYGVLITHFFLDCLTTDEIAALAARLRSHALQDAAWVISEFAIPAGWYGKAVARPLIAALYWAFGWLTGLQVRRLPDHRSALRDSGWSLSEQRRWLGGLLVSELWRAD